MAKEKTIRQKATDELLSKGWVLCVPTRSRFGSSNTYWIENDEKQRVGTDDFFSIFDLMAWKKDKIKLVQYTSRTAVGSRITKINNFIEARELIIPEHIEVEVWGYEDRLGFTRVEKL